MGSRRQTPIVKTLPDNGGGYAICIQALFSVLNSFPHAPLLYPPVNNICIFRETKKSRVMTEFRGRSTSMREKAPKK